MSSSSSPSTGPSIDKIEPAPVEVEWRWVLDTSLDPNSSARPFMIASKLVELVKCGLLNDDAVDPPDFFNVCVRLMSRSELDDDRLAVLYAVRWAYANARERLSPHGLSSGRAIALIKDAISRSTSNAQLSNLISGPIGPIITSGLPTEALASSLVLRDALAQAGCMLAHFTETGARWDVLKLIGSVAECVSGSAAVPGSGGGPSAQAALVAHATCKMEWCNTNLLNAIATIAERVADDVTAMGLVVEVLSQVCAQWVGATFVIDADAHQRKVQEPDPPRRFLIGRIGEILWRYAAVVPPAPTAEGVKAFAAFHVQLALLIDRLTQPRMLHPDDRTELNTSEGFEAMLRLSAKMLEESDPAATAPTGGHLHRAMIVVQRLAIPAATVALVLGNRVFRSQAVAVLFRPLLLQRKQLSKPVLQAALAAFVRVVDVLRDEFDHEDEAFVDADLAFALCDAASLFKGDYGALPTASLACLRCASGVNLTERGSSFHSQRVREKLVDILASLPLPEHAVAYNLLRVIANTVESSESPTCLELHHPSVLREFLRFFPVAQSRKDQCLFANYTRTLCTFLSLDDEFSDNKEVPAVLIKIALADSGSDVAGLAAITSVLSSKDRTRSQYLSSELREHVASENDIGCPTNTNMKIAFLGTAMRETLTKLSEFYCTESMRNALMRFVVSTVHEAPKSRTLITLQRFIQVAVACGKEKIITNKMRDVVFDVLMTTSSEAVITAAIDAIVVVLTQDPGTRTRHATPAFMSRCAALISGQGVKDEMLRSSIVNLVCVVSNMVNVLGFDGGPPTLSDAPRHHLFDTEEVRSAFVSLGMTATSDRVMDHLCRACVWFMEQSQSPPKIFAQRLVPVLHRIGPVLAGVGNVATFVRLFNLCLVPATWKSLLTTQNLQALSAVRDISAAHSALLCAGKLKDMGGDALYALEAFPMLFVALTEVTRSFEDPSLVLDFAVRSIQGGFLAHVRPAEQVKLLLTLHMLIGFGLAFPTLRAEGWRLFAIACKRMPPEMLAEFRGMKRSWMNSDDARWVIPNGTPLGVRDHILEVKAKFTAGEPAKPIAPKGAAAASAVAKASVPEAMTVAGSPHFSRRMVIATDQKDHGAQLRELDRRWAAVALGATTGEVLVAHVGLSPDLVASLRSLFAAVE